MNQKIPNIFVPFFNWDFHTFIERQNLSPWWNSRAKNARLSEAFKSLVFALASETNGSAFSRNTISKLCVFRWAFRNVVRLAIVEADFYRRMIGSPPVDDRTARRLLKMPARLSRHFMATASIGLPKSKVVAKSYSEFLAFKREETEYYSLRVMNCAVCATMGAGKSTFINALLGSDVLPARCEATTAKITSVYDRDGETRIKGFFQRRNGGKGGVNPDVSLQMLNEWNNDKSISRIFLQGDFDGIVNNGMIVAIHDTPGTNNSLDKSHHKVTIDFLTHNKMDLLVFVLNAEQQRTTDEMALLEEIANKVVKIHRTKMLFILNKADSIDPQKESLDKTLAEYNAFLKKLGYEKPEIYPVASKLARLAKMSDRSNVCINVSSSNENSMSEDEKDFLDIQMLRFRKKNFKSSSGCGIVPYPPSFSFNERITRALWENKQEELALLYSGIPSVEMAISECLTRI